MNQVIVDCDVYKITLISTTTPMTLAVTSASLFTDKPVFVDCVPLKTGNLYQFKSLQSDWTIRMVLGLLERHQKDIYDAA